MSALLKPSVRLDYGTGNPAGFPGYRPVNPWGRPMPKMARRGQVEPGAADEPLYQVFVETAEKGVKKIIPVGPKAARRITERLLAAINAQIALGREHIWSSPRLEKVIA